MNETNPTENKSFKDCKVKMKHAKSIDTYHNIRNATGYALKHVLISLKYRLQYPRDQKPLRLAPLE